MNIPDPSWKTDPDPDNDRICGVIGCKDDDYEKCDLCDNEAVFDGLCDKCLREIERQQRQEMHKRQKETGQYQN